MDSHSGNSPFSTSKRLCFLSSRSFRIIYNKINSLLEKIINATVFKLFMTWLTFLRAVGFLAFGTSLCLPFFTNGLVESSGLWAILSCIHDFFWAGCCLGTTGKPPPTKNTSMFSSHPSRALLLRGRPYLTVWVALYPAWLSEIVSFPRQLTCFRCQAEQALCSSFQKPSLLSANTILNWTH